MPPALGEGSVGTYLTPQAPNASHLAGRMSRTKLPFALFWDGCEQCKATSPLVWPALVACPKFPPGAAPEQGCCQKLPYRLPLPPQRGLNRSPTDGPREGTQASHCHGVPRG